MCRLSAVSGLWAMFSTILRHSRVRYVLTTSSLFPYTYLRWNIPGTLCISMESRKDTLALGTLSHLHISATVRETFFFVQPTGCTCRHIQISSFWMKMRRTSSLRSRQDTCPDGVCRGYCGRFYVCRHVRTCPLALFVRVVVVGGGGGVDNTFLASDVNAGDDGRPTSEPSFEYNGWHNSSCFTH